MGNATTKASPFTVEVHFVPLPESEAEERRQHLGALLFRAALRVAQPQSRMKPDEAGSLEPVQK